MSKHIVCVCVCALRKEVGLTLTHLLTKVPTGYPVESEGKFPY